MNVLVALLLAVIVPAKAGEVGGRKIFSSKCALCHAKDGKGNEKTAKIFNVKPEVMNLTLETTQKKTDADLVQVILAGRGKMKGFKGKLKDADVSAALAYVRSLASAPKSQQPKN